MTILEEAGGWLAVLKEFSSVHADQLKRCPKRLMVLLIDFDGQEEKRLRRVQEEIPDSLKDRVFILGASMEPEDLKPDLGSFETIGAALAKDCRDGTNETWSHEYLQHNASEVQRLRRHVRPILFEG